MQKLVAFFGVAALFGVCVGQDACSSPLTLSGPSGTFSTRNPYLNSQKCRWILNGTPGKALELTFGRLDIESATSCNYDYVVVYDSDAVEDVVKFNPCSSSNLNRPDRIGPYCGSTTPDVITATGNRMVVEFCSDSSTVGAGFEITFKETTSSPPPASGSACNETVTVDGRHTVTYYSSAGYAAYQNCFYSYTSKSGKPLKITSQRFATEGYIGCRYDSLCAYDGASSVGKSLGCFCGTNGPKNIRSTGSSLYLSFSSDEYTNANGFSLTIEESCSGAHLCSKDDDSLDVCYGDANTCDGKRDCANGQDESFCADDCGSYAGWTAGSPFPGAAAITHIDGQIHCGGALINSQYILTTAHCFHRMDNKPERFVVKLGAARLDQAYVSQIEKITVHSLFNPKTLANNLALVKLKAPAPVQSSIAPFCVPFTTETSTLAEGASCYTLGWGRTNANSHSSYASTAKQFTATVLNNSRCRWSSSPVVVDGNNVCASTSGQLCYGDNGAPLVCKHKNNKWQVYGINSVSFGCTGSSTTPSSFVKVSAYSSWITETAFSA